ncbi:MAG: tryptophan-rich sensory protein [Oscillospiraceae bacterium]|nr:tryptophan-rich sensory protein [Oscillospiraceae bacterium]
MKKRSIIDILIWIIGAELTGAVSALLSGGFSDFYEKYRQPPLLPPGWLFPVVWTVLYAVMGFSAYLIYSSDAEYAQRKRALTVYFIQLGLNFSWSIIFFRLEMLWAAFGVIILLWLTIILMIRLFRGISSAAAYMNIPYLLWVSFAAWLNFMTAWVNRG